MHIVEDADSDLERREAEKEWLNGGSALTLVRLLVARGWTSEAGAVARLALSREDCADAQEIEDILDRLSDPPPAWSALLDSFVEAPSIERWREMMHFVPPELIYQRQRSSVRYLKRHGVDGDILFLCACEYGVTPDAIELVEEGRVKATTILERAERAGGARTTYIGLAAQAAYLSGDFLGTVRLLRQSMHHANEWCSVLPHVAFIRERATEAENDALDKAGIPAW